MIRVVLPTGISPFPFAIPTETPKAKRGRMEIQERPSEEAKIINWRCGIGERRCSR